MPGAPLPEARYAHAVFWKRLGPWHFLTPTLSGGALIIVLTALMEALAPSILGRLVDHLIDQPRASVPWWGWAACMGAWALAMVGNRWTELWEAQVSGRVQAHVHTRLLAAVVLARQPNKTAPAMTAQRLNQAAEAMADWFESGVVQAARLGCAVLATTWAAWLLAPELGMTCLAWSIVLLALTVWLTPQTGALHDYARQAQGEATAHATETLRLWDEVRRHGQGTSEVNQGSRLAQEVRDRDWARWRYTEWRLLWMGLAQVGFVGTILAMGLVRWSQGTGSPGDVAAAVGLALILTDHLQWAGQQINAAAAARGVVENVMAHWPSLLANDWVHTEPEDPEAPWPEGTLLGERVHAPGWRKQDFGIEPGWHVAVAGPRRGGREVMWALLTGRTPWKGWLGIGGVPWRPHVEPSLRGHVVELGNNPQVFQRSLRENVWYGQPPDRPLSDWQRAILEGVERLPQGWETVWSEQWPDAAIWRQKIALARWAWSEVHWLLMEEPRGTPSAVKAWLHVCHASLPEHITWVCWLNTPSPADLFDSVWWVDSGRIQAQGHHVEQMVASGPYAQWWSQRSS